MSEPANQNSKDGVVLDDESVKQYLRSNPDFFQKNSDVLVDMLPPAEDQGENILDMQEFVMSRLQNNIKDLRKKYNNLVSSCYDNMVIQKQISRAIIALVKTHDLNQLLEVITIDLAQLFDVDLVRLCIESVDTSTEDLENPENLSGIKLIPIGLADKIITGKDRFMLVEDTSKKAFNGFDDVFENCESLAISCAMIKVSIGDGSRKAILGFATRKPEFFTPKQGTDLLAFLADIIEFQLEKCLQQSLI